MNHIELYESYTSLTGPFTSDQGGPGIRSNEGLLHIP